MYIDTYQYERTHRKAPRGYGTWGFYIGCSKRWLSSTFWFTGKYGDARRAAVAHAKANSCDRIFVCD